MRIRSSIDLHHHIPVYDLLYVINVSIFTELLISCNILVNLGEVDKSSCMNKLCFVGVNFRYEFIYDFILSRNFT